MASPQLVLGVPAAILNLVQEGLLERSFHDGLFPALQFRSEAMYEEWPENAGTQMIMSRPGLLAPITKGLSAGTDPTPQTLNYEQWFATLNRYAGTIDTHMPTSTVAAQNLFMRNVMQLGLQSGQSINRISRNSLFKGYLSGQTATIAAAAAGDKQIRVAALNGFQDVIIKGTTVRPTPVSVATPLSITIAGVTGARNVVAQVPDSPDDPDGPGTLTLDAAIGGGGIAARAAVLSAFRPQLIRISGGASVDSLVAGSTLTLQSCIDAVNRLRRNNVRPHEDGYFHAHISTDGNTQVFADAVFQRLNQSLPDGVRYQEAFLGTIAGIAFFLNNETPDSLNTGLQTPTGTNAFYGEDIGAETVNETGVRVGRTIITGRGTIYEKRLDETSFITEAGTTGKIGDFQIVNAGVTVATEGIKLILRAPLNRLQDVVSASWSISTSFPLPSDVTFGGNERFKRAIAIEHSLA